MKPFRHRRFHRCGRLGGLGRFAGCAAIALILGSFAAAQEPEADSPAAYVPEFSLGCLQLRPQPVLQSPRAQWMPIEVAQAWGEENLGVDPTKIQQVKLVFGMPIGPAAPPIGAVVTLGDDFDPAEINPDLLLAPQPITVADRSVYRVGDRGQEFYLHAPNPRTALIATPMMFESMVAQPEGAGPLAERIRANPVGEDHFQLLVVIEPARPMLLGLAEQAAARLPAEIRDLSRIPQLLQAVIVRGRLEGADATARAELVAADAEAAGELKQILDRAIEFGRDMFVRQMKSDVRGEGPVADAQRAYFERIARQFAEALTPRQEKERLVLETEAGISVASTGFLVGMLLPAVQAAREAARRMEASNNLKQIGLAMHNYHAAHGGLPPRAITDEAGKPLLSWRVALLPFLEQQALYEQFRLDEPWDSEHNRPLVEKMPELYRDPSVAIDPGQTVFQAPVGEASLLQATESTSFREVTDGLSETILVVEADRRAAVPWSAPQDVKIDAEVPLSSLGHAHAGGFHALFADGSVKFLTHNIDLDVLRAMLTRAGGEEVGAF